MTIGPFELTDPGQTFLAQGPERFLDRPDFFAQNDPERFLADNLPITEDAPAGDDGPPVAKIAVGLAGAYLAWRYFFKSRLQQLQVPVEPKTTLEWAWKMYAPLWLKLSAPVFAELLTEIGPLTPEEAEAVAIDFATDTGQYLHESSAEAVVAGYRAELRRGASPTLAWLRSSEGYGLDTRRLQGWLAGMGDTTETGDIVTPAGRRSLDRALLARATLLGENEAWHAREMGKSVVWLTIADDLPGAGKRWVTKDDELVCPVCGPLHLKVVGLREKFSLPDGRSLWAPGVHPNCRCHLELVQPDKGTSGEVYIQKARGSDPYDRDTQGRFSRYETRRTKPVAERQPVDPWLQAALDAALDEAPPAEVLDQGPSMLDEPSLLSQGDEGPSLLSQGPSLLDTGPSMLGDSPSATQDTAVGPKLLIIFNGKPVQVDANDGRRLHPDKHAMALADDYYMRLPGHISSWESSPDNPIFHVGMTDPVDFDHVARLKGAHGAPEPVIGYAFSAAKGGVRSALYGASDTHYRPYTVTQSQHDAVRQFYDAQQQFYQNVRDSPEDYIAYMSDAEIERFMLDHAPDEYNPNWVSTGTMRVDLASHITEGHEELGDALAHWAFRHDLFTNLDEEIADAKENLDDAMGERGYIRSVNIFSFPQGFIGEWEDGKLPRIRGKYRITKIVHHELGPDGPERIYGWNDIQLTPLPDDEQEH